MLSEEDYVYNGAGNLTGKTVDGATTTYTYDDIDQLLTESRTGYSATYTYDANGNRASKTLGGVTETYTNDDADKLTSITSGGVMVKSFGYDSAGRTTSVTTSAGTTTLAYDYESRVTTITYPSTATNTFTYNGLDTRVGKVDSAGTATYKRDGAHVTAPVVSDGFATYTPGISERRSSTTKYFGADRLGTNSLETNTSQAVTATKTYDAFGMPVGSTGSSASPFGFAGRHGYQEDADSGLKLLGHRYYDASTGRFLTRDPIEEGRNWYQYCGNSPNDNYDGIGLQKATLHVSNKGVGHAWIEIDHPRLGKIIIENNTIGNVRMGDQALDPTRKPDVSRTLPFDPKKNLVKIIGDLPYEYNLWSNNCVTTACKVWFQLTNEDLLPGRDTPGRLQRDVERINRKKPGGK